MPGTLAQMLIGLIGKSGPTRSSLGEGAKEVTTVSVRAAFLGLLGLLTFLGIFTIVYLIQNRGQVAPGPGELRPGPGREPGQAHQPIPVALNRGPEVLDGFRGDVHPLLFGQTQLETTAEWTPVGKGRDQLHRDLNPRLYAWFTELRPARPRQTYTQRDFSAFLPQTVGEVGQLWALDADKMVGILKQFHPRPSMQLVAAGRRAGPNGAFAILRGVSPTYLDIAFRIHAEFYLTPDDWPADRPLIRAWYTPAYFSGTLLVNKQTGTVDHFRLELPTDKALNVHLTVIASGIGDTRQARDVVRVEHMELTSGDRRWAENVSWTKSLTAAEAESQLAKVFYKFLDIDWVPFDQVKKLARDRGRPIFAVVSWGAFEDQSC
jgi:hypothetical protein